MVIGGIGMSIWSGFKRRVNGVLLGWFLTGVFSFGLGISNGLPFWVTFIILSSVVAPLVNTSNQAIWQSKVAPDVQGRVFSSRRLIAWFSQPISPLIAGVMADRWLEPSMSGGKGLMAALFSGIVGNEPGSGMALLFAVSGVFMALIGLSGYLIPAIRDVETNLPDHG